MNYRIEYRANGKAVLYIRNKRMGVYANGTEAEKAALRILGGAK